MGADILVNWGLFFKNYNLLLSQFSKISNQMDFWEKLSNFDYIFYVMLISHKKLSQHLRVSPENPFDREFLKIGSVTVYSFIKKIFLAFIRI